MFAIEQKNVRSWDARNWFKVETVQLLYSLHLNIPSFCSNYSGFFIRLKALKVRHSNQFCYFFKSVVGPWCQIRCHVIHNITYCKICKNYIWRLMQPKFFLKILDCPIVFICSTVMRTTSRYMRILCEKHSLCFYFLRRSIDGPMTKKSNILLR